MVDALTLDDFETHARRILPASLYAFVTAGSGNGRSKDKNHYDFLMIDLFTRVLRDVSDRSCEVEFLDCRFAAPIGIAPMGMAGAMRFEGDLALARAAHSSKIPFILSGAAFEPLEEVAAQAPGSWFQAYLSGNPAVDAAMVERIKQAGYKTLVITVDTPVPPSREASMRAGGLGVPVRPTARLVADTFTHPRWAADTLARTLIRKGIPRLANMGPTGGPRISAPPAKRPRSARETLTWDHILKLRNQWQGKLIVKGILAPQDAIEARKTGVDALIVSNHGGRQLDGTISPIAALPAVRAAIGDLPLIMDGGIRRGDDIVKALATGADMVLIGRPFLYALAAYGQPGVTRAIDLIIAELLRAMALMGCNHVSDLTPTCLAPSSSIWGPT
ncbi:MAG TPA: alpha-hydroxy acid oxidase [Sphingobium sp.]|nr:alpha-hydroxy acid oxidase [Sphingobium sp.]